MSQRVKKLPSKGKGEDGGQTMSEYFIFIMFFFSFLFPLCYGQSVNIKY